MTRKNEGEAQSPAEKPAAGPRQRPVLAAMRKGERAKRGEELTTPALSWLARPGVFRRQLKKRRKFLLKELKREKATLMSIYEEVGHKSHEAVWMVGLMIDQLRTEIRWNRQLEQSLARRARALYPSVFSEGLPE